jgi:hypothetical protein
MSSQGVVHGDRWHIGKFNPTIPGLTGVAPANFRIWWDGDLLSENLDGNKISKWAYPGMPADAFSGATLSSSNIPGGNRPPLYGDMFGDWREEVMLEQSPSLRIYATAIPTDERIYTLMHNPEYRNAMVEKGYTQSRFVDFYLGEGMTDPPRPNITYPDGCAGCAGAGGGGTNGAADASGNGGTTGPGGGSIVSGGTPSPGGAGAPGGRGGRGGSVAASGGNPTTGGTSALAGSGGAAMAGAGGTAPGTGGNPATGGSTLGASGGAGMAGAGGTSAAEPGAGGSTSGGEGGAVGGHGDTIAAQAAAGSGCSCAIGATSGRASAGYFVVMLGGLGLALNRRRQRGNPRK